MSAALNLRAVRADLYACFGHRRDALYDLMDALASGGRAHPSPTSASFRRTNGDGAACTPRSAAAISTARPYAVCCCAIRWKADNRCTRWT